MSDKYNYIILVCMGLALLSACSGDTGTGPKAIKWDRDACERCRMVLSDRYSSAQVRYQPPDKKRMQVAMFDDFGCAVLWLEDKPWRDDPQTEVWVTDHLTGEWINGLAATYVPGKITPMEYGLGAQKAPAPGGLSFAQAKAHVVRVEQRFNAHGVHLLEKYKQQAASREENLRHQQGNSSLPPRIPLAE